MDNETALEKWEPAAWDLSPAPDKIRGPFHVLVGEAVDVARFAQRNWHPGTDHRGKVVRPGLSSAVGAGQFTESIATDVLELEAAVQLAQTRYRLLVDSAGPAPVDRAQFILIELRETLEWYFDDGEVDESDAQLEALAEAHEQAMSHDAIAAALYDYAELAERHQTAIEGLGGFDTALIEEARQVGARLREQSAGPAQPVPPPDQRQALDLRNRLAALLYDRMQRVRAAARFVFRRHPDLVREVTSAYSRRQRNAYRRQRAEREVVEQAPTQQMAVVEGQPSAE